MSRWVGLATDPVASGSRLEDLLVATTKVIAPTTFFPVTTAQVDPGENDTDRNEEVRGRRGNTAPVAFQAQPFLTMGGRAYPDLTALLISRGLGGTIAEGGGPSPKAITSTVEPKQSGALPALVAWLVREAQVDRLTGCWVSEFELKLPIDKEGEYTCRLDALYHDFVKASELEGTPTSKDPSGATSVALPTASYASNTEGLTFQLMTAEVFRGGSSEGIEDLAGVTLNFNNSLIDDPRSRFRPNKNIRSKSVSGKTRRLWLPNRHKLGAQNITGTIDLSDVDVSEETRRLFRGAEKLVIEVAAGDAATTPTSNELLRIEIGQSVNTGGGADPLIREGDQVASYDFGGYIDASTNKDIAAVFSKKALVP